MEEMKEAGLEEEEEDVDEEEQDEMEQVGKYDPNGNCEGRRRSACYSRGNRLKKGVCETSTCSGCNECPGGPGPAAVCAKKCYNKGKPKQDICEWSRKNGEENCKACPECSKSSLLEGEEEEEEEMKE